MFVRRERPGDQDAIRRVHAAAFRSAENPNVEPVEVGLVDALRASDAWLPPLSLVAVLDDAVVGHVVCTRGRIVGADERPALGLGPVGVLPDRQRRGVGLALMHAVIGAADALDETVIACLGDPAYYARFGFVPSASVGIAPPNPEWAPAFQVRPLSAHDPAVRGEFRYAAPFDEL